MLNEKQMSYFLSCGYLPDFGEKPLDQLLGYDFSSLVFDKYNENHDEKLLIDDGIKALKACFEEIDSNDQILPLSGGLDSRLILGSLLEAGIKDRIQALTYGQPGSYNYEIPTKLVKKFGVKHRRIDLTDITINTDSLVQVAKNGGSWVIIFDAFFNSIICREFGKEVTYWTGHIGDPLAGSHLPNEASSSWEEARKLLASWNNLIYNANFVKPGLRLEECLPSEPLFEQSVLSFDEQLDFGIRQKNFIEKVLFLNGYKFSAPFVKPEWVQFWLNLPRKHRIKRYLFNKIAHSAYPELFELPTESYLGAGLPISYHKLFIRRALNKTREVISNRLNNYGFLRSFWESMNVYRRLVYIDYKNALRNRKDYQEVVQENLSDLKNRKIIDWIDIDSIYQNHQRKYCDNSLAILCLISLEINLKASE